jgi:hypothetical protein
MLTQTHLRHCIGCGTTTHFQPVKIGNAVGLVCLTCGRRLVAHYCSHPHSTLGALQTSEPELLPLLIDFGIKRAFDAYCPGCRQAISVVNATSEAVRPYSTQSSNFLDQLAQAMAVGMVVITAAGVGGWIARQLR